jgi:hypothetical protein
MALIVRTIRFSFHFIISSSVIYVGNSIKNRIINTGVAEAEGQSRIDKEIP